MKDAINTIWSPQMEFKDTIRKQEDVLAFVDKRTQSLCEELDMAIQGIQFDIQARKMTAEAIWWDF
jgi:hypothetical protein